MAGQEFFCLSNLPQPQMQRWSNHNSRSSHHQLHGTLFTAHAEILAQLLETLPDFSETAQAATVPLRPYRQDN